MNKQEAIEEIKNTDTLNINDRLSGQQVDFVIKNQVLDIVSRISEPQKAVVPQYVADWVDNSRECDYEFCDFFDCNNQSEEVYKWLNCEKRRQSELNALALSTLIVHGRDAVIVEKETRYKVRIRNLNAENGFLNYDNVGNMWVFNNRYNTNDYKTIHTRKELEANGFGWVFDCEGIEIEEV